MKKNRGMITVFMTPAVVMFVLVFLYPIIRTILMSFFKIEGITDPMSKWTFSGIDNYVKLANTTLFRISMWNLARIWFIGGIIVMSLALLFAVLGEEIPQDIPGTNPNDMARDPQLKEVARCY